MAKYKFWTVLFVAFCIWAGFFIWNGEKQNRSDKFKLGLDLSGGTRLIYKADTSIINESEADEAMVSLRDTIERRVNLFGVSEPLIQVQKSGVFGGGEERRLVVELPGITNIDEAIKKIGQTPSLEFKLLPKDVEEDIKTKELTDKNTISRMFVSTGLDGRMLEKATLQFDQNFANKPIVGIKFNEEGSKLFAKITRENIGNMVGIFLDSNLIEAPSIREEIEGGEAVITGNFSVAQAKQVIRDLNYGALPLPISLISTETVGASLGNEAVKSSVNAGLYAFIIISLFLIVWYGFNGLVASFALLLYSIINLLLFKFIPVTLTSAGIAGFILSIGMAVDANILIFERTKEELKKGKDKYDALNEGFNRAWSSIRDSNLSSIITAVILYYFASTPVVKGFALVFFIGVLVSMFSAITASRTILFAFTKNKN